MSDSTQSGNPPAATAMELALRAHLQNWPTTTDDFAARRQVPRRVSFTQQVEGLHLELWENPVYRKYWEGIDSDTSQEGSLTHDRAFAAKMIRDLARENGHSDVVHAQTARIAKAATSIMRLHNMGVRQRRLAVIETAALIANQVAGEPMGNAD